MHILEEINPYPVQERLIYAPWDTEEIIDKIKRNLRTTFTPDELARLMSHSHGDNALPNALHKNLESNTPYKTAKQLSPYLKDVPEISRYRNSYKTHNPAEVISEILNAGVYLPAGQIVFHGGPWPGSTSLPPVGTVFATSQPLSTTLCPQVAAVHSLYEPRGFIWKITLSTNTPCFVFNNKNRVLGHEFEILLPPINISCIGVENTGTNIPILHVSADFHA
jgi:hypothetical protein